MTEPEKPKRRNLFQHIHYAATITFGDYVNVSVWVGTVVICVVGYAFTIGQEVKANEATNARQDAEDVRLYSEITTNKAETSEKLDKIQADMSKGFEDLQAQANEDRRNTIKIMIALGIQPVGG